MKQRVILIIDVLISAASLWWVFNGVNFDELLTALTHVHWVAILPSLFFFYGSMYLRAVRWSVLFRPRNDLSGRRLFRPVMIGFAFNCNRMGVSHVDDDFDLFPRILGWDARGILGWEAKAGKVAGY